MNPRTSPVVVRCFGECMPCALRNVATVLGAFLLISGRNPELSAQPQDLATVPFAAADAGWDLQRGTLYLTHKTGKKVVALSLQTGGIAAQHPVGYMPESIAVTPDGRRMYVALLTREHDPGWWDEDGHEGYIAEFDLEDGVKTRELHITEDPFDLVATDGGFLVVSSGSGQWTYVRSFKIETGEEVGSWSIRERSHLSLHPSQTAVYAADTDSSPSDIERFTLDPGTGAIPASWECIYHGDHPMDGNVFAHPGGAILITRGGGVYTSSEVQAEDMRYIETLENKPIEHIAFDVARKAMFTVTGTKLCFLNSETLQRVNTWTTPSTSRFVAASADWVYIGSTGTAQTRIQRLQNPAAGGDSNTPPQADFSWSPSEVDIGTDVAFDAGASADAEDALAALSFRWDWESDGTFDTAFSASPAATHRYGVAGTKRVTLQVKDSRGLLGEVRKDLNVAGDVDPGVPGQAQTAFELTFAAADVAFDPVRPYLYATSLSRRLLVRVSLETGFTERQWDFANPPESIAITPDGRWLYAALLVMNPDGRPRNDEGYIAEIELDSGAKRQEFPVGSYLRDIAATDSRFVIASMGRDDWQGLSSFDADTGKEASRLRASTPLKIGLHPSQAAVYAAYSSSLLRAALDPVTGAFKGSWESAPHGQYPMGGDVSVHPDGTRLITRGGGVYTSSDVQAEDMRYIRTLAKTPTVGVAFDARNHALFAVTGGELCHINADSLELVSCAGTLQSSTFAGVLDDVVYSVSLSTSRTTIQTLRNPALGGDSNTPPRPDFTWTPASPTTLAPVVFDARSSSDEQDAIEKLLFRWDWDGDGVFDTQFSSQATASHHYNVAGTKAVVLQVKDSLGLVSEVRKDLNVAAEADPGTPGEANTAFELQFAASDVEFDSARGCLYATARSAKRLVKVSLLTGFIERQWDFTYKPEAIALTPDGRRMYVGLPVRDHSSYWWDEDGHEGYVAEFDLEAGVKTREFRITEDPYDLVATDGGFLVVSSGSGQWTEIRSFKAETGEMVGRGGIYERGRLALHPSQAAVYAADTGLSPSDIERFTLDPSTGAITGGWDSIYHGDHPMGGNVFAHPGGELLITRGGGVYTSSDVRAEDMLYIQTLEERSMEGLAFDVARKAMFGVTGTKLCFYNSESLQLAWSASTASDSRFVGIFGDLVYSVSVSWSGNRTTVQTFQSPALGGDTNTPPQPDFTWSPESPTTLVPIAFDAGPSLDGQDPIEKLLFRWDWEGDGVFDTKFSSETIASHQYNVAGTKSVVLQAKDTLGLIGEVRKDIDVAAETDPGTPGEAHTAFELNLVAADVEFDSTRGHLYATGRSEKFLLKVNLETGFTEREWDFTNHPEEMAMTPDGRRLYVILQVLDGAGQAKWDEGYVAEFDLEAGVKTQEFPIGMYAYDIVATDHPFVLLSGGAGNDAGIHSFDARTGLEAGYAGWWTSIRLALHPSQTAVYMATMGVSPSDISRLTLDPETGAITDSWESIYHGDHPMGGDVFVHADGTRVITYGGGVYTSSSVQAEDMRYIRTLEEMPIAGVTFDVKNRALFAVTGQELCYFNAESLELVSCAGTLQSSTFAGVLDDVVYSVSLGKNRTTIQVLANPALGGDSNTPPRPDFAWTPASPTTLAPVVFDAGSSRDEQDAIDKLLFRWDWDGDGAFDTEFSSQATASHHYNVAGTKAVVLQVKDSQGLTGEVRKDLNVAVESDPGTPGEAHTAFELQFVVSDVAFDSARGHLYATGRSEKRLLKVDLDTGFTERQWDFNYMPESIAISPDGSWMYVALLTREHSAYWWDEEGHEGYIAEFDLEAGVKTREFHIAEDPYDLVVTDAGFLVVPSGSGQWTHIRSFDVRTGLEVGVSGIRHASHIALHPSQQAVYTADTDVSPSDIARYGLDPGTGAIRAGWESIYHGDHPMGGRVYVHPSGGYVITGGGGIYTCSEVQAQDMRYITEFSGGAAAVVFDPDAARFLRAPWQEGDEVVAHDDATYAELERFLLPEGADAEFLGISGPFLFAVTPTKPHTRIDKVLLGREVDGPAFIRGDPNSSGATDIADAVSILRYSFAGDPGTMRCEDAGDASDDGAIDIQDAILLLNYLFKGGPPPSPTLKSGSGGMLRAGCGTDPTSDGLGCRLYGACTP